MASPSESARTGPRRGGRLSPLRITGFGRLATANVVNELGNWLGEIALAVIVFERTGSPIATAGLFLAMQFAPALLGPPLVARVEPAGARAALGGIYLAEAIAFAALALTAAEGALAIVLAIAVVDGALASAARALTRASAASVLAPPGLLREGNAILNVAFTAGAAAGPAIAGVVVASAGPETALFVDSGSFLCVAVLLATAQGLPRAQAQAEGVWERLRAGLAHVGERPALRLLLAAQAAAFVFFALVIPIEVVFAIETLDAGDTGYGALLASWGAGMIAGSFAFAGLRSVSLRALLALSTLAIGVAYLGTAAAPTLIVACATSALGGLGNGVQWVALITAVQELTAPAYQARVVASLEALAGAMPGVGFVLGGLVASAFDPRVAYAVAGAGVIVVLVAGVVALRRAEWRAVAAKFPPQMPAVPRLG
jgi:MFS family permease